MAREVKKEAQTPYPFSACWSFLKTKTRPPKVLLLQMKFCTRGSSQVAWGMPADPLLESRITLDETLTGLLWHHYRY